MRQVVRTLSMADGDACRVLICDRDSKWSVAVRERLEEAGIHVVRTPYEAPNANPYAERFVRSMKLGRTRSGTGRVHRQSTARWTAQLLQACSVINAHRVG
jgi:hypothetical protein